MPLLVESELLEQIDSKYDASSQHQILDHNLHIGGTICLSLARVPFHLLRRNQSSVSKFHVSNKMYR